MVKVVELKDRAIERIGRFREDPKTLPALVHARYLVVPKDQVAGATRVKGTNFALRKHKPHQMHSQHRATTSLLLEWLVRKLDVRTRECVFVNPTRGIRRPPYVPEMARALGVCERTITRCLGSLTRSRYLARDGRRFFISRALFIALHLDVTYDRLAAQLAGLDKKNKFSAPDKVSVAQASPNQSQPTGPVHPSHLAFEKAVPHKKSDPQFGNDALKVLRRSRSRPPD